MATQVDPPPAPGWPPATGSTEPGPRGATAARAWPSEAAALRRVLQVMVAVEIAYAAFLFLTWLGSSDVAAGVALIIDVLAVAGCGAVWALAARGRVVEAVSVLTLGVIGLALPLAAVPPATPALAVLPLLGVAIALQCVHGRTLLRLMVLGWVASGVVALIVELVPAGGPQPAWYYPLMRVSSFSALIGITLVLLAQFGSRLRHSLAASERARSAVEAADAALRTSEAHYRTLVEQAPVGIVVVGSDGRVAEINPLVQQLLRLPAGDILGRPVADFIEPVDLAAHPVRLAGLAPGETLHSERVVVDAAGNTLTIAFTSTALAEGGYQLIAEDISERRRGEAERARLVQGVEQSADSIVITDASATIVYVNPAFERASGFSRAEAVGASPRILRSGKQGPEVYRAMWAELAAGRPWSGELVNRRKDGTLYREQVTISPVRDAGGAIVNYVAVQRDVTREREMEADLALEANVRDVLTTALRQVPAEASLELAAQTICEELARLPLIDVVAIAVFGAADEVEVFAIHPVEGLPFGPGSRLMPDGARHLRERAGHGPWAETGEPQADGEGWSLALVAPGLKAVAFGPIVHGDQVEGLLAIGTTDPAFARTLVERTPAITALSTTSSALLAKRLHARRRAAELRRELKQVAAGRAFRPVFQPIVDLQSGEVVGHEALTRFDSGQRPDLCFADAWSVGLGPDLEIATIEAAVAAAKGLPSGRWLDLNVSPRMLADPDRLRALLWGADRPIVLEITEHELIEDYGAVREAIGLLGHDIRLAVDDAGAGVANFGHIIELRPDFVKLDMSLVRRVNANLGRQALVVGMRHFSRTAGCRLVAEGIETEEEAATLRGLGVEFGQGYLFGHPQSVEAWATGMTAGGTGSRQVIRVEPDRSVAGRRSRPRSAA